MSAQNMMKQSRTDWEKIKAMKDSDIDFSDASELDDEFFTEALTVARQEETDHTPP